LNLHFRERSIKKDLSTFICEFRHEKKDVCPQGILSEKAVIVTSEAPGRGEGAHDRLNNLRIQPRCPGFRILVNPLSRVAWSPSVEAFRRIVFR
jgi:hypothetical protein